MTNAMPWNSYGYGDHLLSEREIDDEDSFYADAVRWTGDGRGSEERNT